MLWADVTDPLVVSAIETGCADPDYAVPVEPDPLVLQSLEIASSVLNRLSGYQIHPAGEATDEITAYPQVHRISPNFRPVRTIVSVTRGGEDMDISRWEIRGQSIYFSGSGCTLGAWYQSVCQCTPQGETLAVKYTFGSTVTAAARAALLYFAHQLWLMCNGDDCELPDRVTSVNREGLSYSIIDPMQFLDKYQTGIPRVDLWLNTINPSKAKRSAAVYTPDSPPPVNRRVRRVG